MQAVVNIPHHRTAHHTNASHCTMPSHCQHFQFTRLLQILIIKVNISDRKCEKKEEHTPATSMCLDAVHIQRNQVIFFLSPNISVPCQRRDHFHLCAALETTPYFSVLRITLYLSCEIKWNVGLCTYTNCLSLRALVFFFCSL